MQIKAFNATAHQILKNKVDLILPKFYTECRDKRGIFWCNNFRIYRVSFEGISGFLHHK